MKCWLWYALIVLMVAAAFVAGYLLGRDVVEAKAQTVLDGQRETLMDVVEMMQADREELEAAVEWAEHWQAQYRSLYESHMDSLNDWYEAQVRIRELEAE